MKCKICESKSDKVFTSKMLSKYDIAYFFCRNCGFLQTEKPYWLDEAYQESINLSDTGYLSRNLHLSKITSIFLYLFFNKNARFIDYGGGYGVFVRLMRDIGFDFYWQDAYTENLFARGFEAKNIFYEFVTSFETFEHFVEPDKEIRNMLKLSDNILFSTELYGDTVPLPNEWHYYGLNHGQHISFYNIRTLQYIAQKYSLQLWSNGHSLHLLTKQKIKPILLKIAYYSNKIKFAGIVKRLMNSKTLSDWNYLKNYGKKNNIASL